MQAKQQQFDPLKSDREITLAAMNGRRQSFQRILLWLKDNPESAESKRRKEIAETEAKLAALKAAQRLTQADNPIDLAERIRTADQWIAETEKQRAAAVAPLQQRFLQLVQLHRNDEEKLKPVIEGLFRESLVNREGRLERFYTSFNYANCTGSAIFRHPGQVQSACVCYVYLADNKPAKPDLGLLGERYPICYRSQSQLEIRVRSVRVTISSRDPQIKGSALGQTLMDLVDLEKLESLVAN